MENISATALACTAAATFGTRIPGDKDNRRMPTTFEIFEAAGIIANVLSATTMQGESANHLADDFSEIALSGLADAFHKASEKTGNYMSKLEGDLKNLVRDLMAKNGGLPSEVDANTLDDLRTQIAALEEREEALCEARAAFVAMLSKTCGTHWTPSHSNKPITLADATLFEARQFLAARRVKATPDITAMEPVIFFADKSVTTRKTADEAAKVVKIIFAKLDALHNHFPGMALIHCGQRDGGDKLAQDWAKAKGVPLILQKTNWAAGKGAKAIFSRNDDMLKMKPVAVVGYPADNIGLTKLAENAKAKGFNVKTANIDDELAAI